MTREVIERIETPAAIPRLHFENDPASVQATVCIRSIQIAQIIHDQSPYWSRSGARFIEAIEDLLRPGWSRWPQLVNRSPIILATLVVHSVEVPGCIEDNATLRTASVSAIAPWLVKHSFSPTAARRSQLVNGTTRILGSVRCCAINVSRLIEDEVTLWERTDTVIKRKNHRFARSEEHTS